MVVMHWRDEFFCILKWWGEALLLEAGLCSTGRKHLILHRSAHHQCHCHAHHGWQALVGLMTVVTEAMDVVLTLLMLELDEVFGFSNRIKTMPLSKWIHSIILFPQESIGGHEWGTWILCGLHMKTPVGGGAISIGVIMDLLQSSEMV